MVRSQDSESKCAEQLGQVKRAGDGEEGGPLNPALQRHLQVSFLEETGIYSQNVSTIFV